MSSSEGTLKEERTRTARRADRSDSVGHLERPSRNGPASEAIRNAGFDVASRMLGATDPATAQHSDDVELLAGELCERLGVEGQDRETLLLAARLHDIGKVAVPQVLLEKREPLDAGDWKLLRKHTVVGERILASAPELASAATLVRHSHENFDGSGYPDGLSGDEIPLGSRIIFCVDAFHAIRCDRSYRNGRSTDAALAEIKAHAGRQFDPKVVKALAKSITSARRPGRRRIPRRVAVLFAALAIGSGGAYATERGWIPSLIPGLGPESTSDEVTESASASSATSSSVGGSPGADGLSSAQGGGNSDLRDLIDAIGGADGSRSARDPRFLGLGGLVPGLGESVEDGGAAQSGGSGPAGGGGAEDGTGSGGGSGGSSGTSPGGGGAATNSGSAGNGGSAPGQVVLGPGGSPPGQSGSTPGQSGSTPGQSGTTPGQSGSNPGSGESPPGQSGLTPGQSGSTPGQSGTAPGNSASAPGHNKL
jgi:putative nucleotidyltransferase with HDIG domain